MVTPVESVTAFFRACSDIGLRRGHPGRRKDRDRRVAGEGRLVIGYTYEAVQLLADTVIGEGLINAASGPGHTQAGVAQTVDDLGREPTRTVLPLNTGLQVRDGQNTAQAGTPAGMPMTASDPSMVIGRDVMSPSGRRTVGVGLSPRRRRP